MDDAGDDGAVGVPPGSVVDERVGPSGPLPGPTATLRNVPLGAKRIQLGILRITGWIHTALFVAIVDDLGANR